MKPDAWIALKALQRANKKRTQIGKLARLDQMLISAGRAPKFGTSRKPMRKARETK
jgi:hypothetical protein